MNVGIIYLDYQHGSERETSNRVFAHNTSNAGYSFQVIKLNIKGIAKAINFGINEFKTMDAVVTMANDILMPDRWLAHMVNAIEKVDKTGMCGIHCVESLGPAEVINDVHIHRSFTAFGNVLIPLDAIRTIGAFNEEYDPYGMQDGDYAYRLNKAGFINYYLHGLKSEHIGHDVGSGTDYRKMKDEGLSKAGEIWNRNMKRYEDDYTINFDECL